MSRHLEEAAELLRRSAETIEKEHNDPRFASLGNPGRERIARQFAELAAIENGQLPASIVELILTQIKGDPK